MKSKLITTMMTALFLTFAVLAPPLLSVPTVSASTGKRMNLFMVGTEWSCDTEVYPSAVYPPPYVPPDNSLENLMFVGYLKGGISATTYTFGIWSSGWLDENNIWHYQNDIVLAFRDGGWVYARVTGILGPDKPFTYKSESFVYNYAEWEGQITGASPDKTNYIGCKISSTKGGVIWDMSGAASNNLGCPWGPAWAVGMGTVHIRSC